MLQITVPAETFYDEVREEFVYGKEQTLRLEHSLVSLSKWESRWHKSFLFTKNKTDEELLDYIKCMTLTQNVSPDVYNRLSKENANEIRRYIDDPMTATVVRETKKGKGNGRILTAELIYYYMISFNIPVEFEKWHLNRLLTLIRVCDAESKPAKKRSVTDIMRDNAKLNAERRKLLNSKG